MQLFSSLAQIPRDFGPSAITIGKFDGVHRGHRAVIAELQAAARSLELTSTVVTFDRNPLSLLRPELCPDPLISNRQKAELLASTGVDVTVILPFDVELSQQSPEDFVLSILVGALRAQVLLIGDDFRFGARGGGDVEVLRRLGSEHGFEVRSIEAVTTAGGRRVSSTRIREHLAVGQVKEAAHLLDALPTIRSTVVPGQQRGRQLGYPTANLSPDIEGYAPADGVYAAWATVAGERYAAAVSIGNNPTFDGVPERQVEVHLFDQQLDLYGREIEVSFVDFIRPMSRFESAVALMAQMRKDDKQIRGLLGVAARRS